MGNWDDDVRLQLVTLMQSLECPKCHEINAPGHGHIQYDQHLRVACCDVCSHAWAVKPAAAV